MRFLLGSDYELFENQLSEDSVIKPADIQEHKMFYNKDNLTQIERLYNILYETNFKRIRNQLSETGMRKGVAIVLYGGPGTGKSETVMQRVMEYTIEPAGENGNEEDLLLSQKYPDLSTNYIRQVICTHIRCIV